MEYIDLGLPSGTLWANKNLGAETETDYGDYYAWGETESNKYCSCLTYKYAKGAEYKLTKYVPQSWASHYGNDGFYDDKTTLDPEDDVAHVLLGGDCRMPTMAEFKELVANTTKVWTMKNGVRGRLFKSKVNSNEVFFPATGYYVGWCLNEVGDFGYYWSSSLDEDYPDNARGFCLSIGYVGTCGNSYRHYGFSVRPVKSNK